MDECILVTEKEFAKGESFFGSQKHFVVQSCSREEQLLAEAVLAKKCRAVILGTDRYSGPLYEALGQTGQDAGAIIARHGVGHDGIDKTLARRHKIVVTNTPGVLETSVAEHAVWLMGCLGRYVASLDTAVKAGEFVGQPGIEMRGRSLGIIGFGPIGRRVAAIAHFGFQMRVLAADILPAEELAKQEGKTFEQVKAAYGLSVYTDDLEAVLREADVVSVHVSASPGTLNLFNAQRLSMMKRGALFINTARGSVVDEDALYDVLADSHLGGAALDVFANEPYEPVSPDKDLRTLNNVVLTPHVASNTVESNERMAKACLKNISDFFLNRLNELTRVDA